MLSFGLSQEEQDLKNVVHDFAAEQLRPVLRDAEQSGAPEALHRAAFDMGIGRMGLPESLEGSGLSLVAQAVIQEELAWGDLALAQALMGPGLAGTALAYLGTPEQQERYLKPFLGANGWKMSGALAGAEPNLGWEKESWQTSFANGALTGSKGLVWPAPADLYVVLTKDGVYALNGAPQVEPSNIRLGLLAVPAGWVTLNNTPAELIGQDVAGLLARVRVILAAQAVGAARALTEYATEYTANRTAFGHVIAQFEAVSFAVADMLANTEAARLMVWRAAWALDQGKEDAHKLAAAALAQAGETAVFCGNWGVQMLGGHGFVFDHPVEKWFRDSRTLATNSGAASAATEQGNLILEAK